LSSITAPHASLALGGGPGRVEAFLNVISDNYFSRPAVIRIPGP
jgi:hypothetical protein